MPHRDRCVPLALGTRGLIATLLLALLASACATGGAPGTSGPSEAQTTGSPSQTTGSPSQTVTASQTAASTGADPTANPTRSPSATTASYPLTITDDEGTRVTISARPERVVSLSPANTETVFALGEGPRVVGGTDFDDYPREAAALPDVADFHGVFIEKVVDRRPDLVLAAGNGFTPPADIAKLRSLGLPVLVLYAESVDEVLHDIELIGTAVGAEAKATTMTASMRARMDAISAAAMRSRDRPRVFYELGDQPEIYGPAKDSFVADMIDLAGGEPLTSGDPAVFTIPLEKLVTADPEVIVLGDANYGATPTAVKARPGGWAGMSAVKEGRIRPIDDIIVTRPGPRLADGLAALAKAIHPDLQLPSPSSSAP